MMSRKCEIKKQVIGEDEHFEKAGRILNRVKWGRDGIKIKAGQGDVEASPIGTNDQRSDSMQRGRNDDSDERVDVDGDRPRPSHEWDRPRMADDDANDSHGPQVVAEQ